MEFVFLALAIGVCAALGYQLYRRRAQRRDYCIGIGVSIVLLALPTLTAGVWAWDHSSGNWLTAYLAWRSFTFFAVCSGGIAVLCCLACSWIRLIRSSVRRLRNKGAAPHHEVWKYAALCGIISGAAVLPVVCLSLMVYPDYSSYFPIYLLVAAAALLLGLWYWLFCRRVGKSTAVVANIIVLMMIAIPLLMATVSFVILCHCQSVLTGEARCEIGKFYDYFGLTGEAYRWYRRADKDGAYYLGRCYDYGRGVPKDMTEAVKWFRKAAEQGVAEAQFLLGASYAFGRGVPKDMTETVKWFRKAAEQGDAKAQYNLGVCYANGDGVKQDYSEAVKWLGKAAAQGNKQTAEVLKELAW
ncbi:MAG: sel1 repeat family protein [Lentisphaeria bacterium]|nr:sel1 repeat family protein [Lentisphaeria bacterium]